MRNEYKIVIKTPRKMVEDPTNKKMLRTPCTVYVAENRKDEFMMMLKIQNINDFKISLVTVEDKPIVRATTQSLTHPLSSPTNELTMSTKIQGGIR